MRPPHTSTRDAGSPRVRRPTREMAGKKPTSSARGGKRAAKPDDDSDGAGEDEDEEPRAVEDRGRGPEDADEGADANGAAEDEDEDVGEEEGTEDRDDGGATAGRIPRDAAVVRDILKSMVRASDRVSFLI